MQHSKLFHSKPSTCQHISPSLTVTKSPSQFLDSSYLAIFQADLDAVGMSSGFGQYLFDDPFSQLVCSLVLFEHNPDLVPYFDIRSFYVRHWIDFFLNYEGRRIGSRPEFYPSGKGERRLTVNSIYKNLVSQVQSNILHISLHQPLHHGHL